MRIRGFLAGLIGFVICPLMGLGSYSWLGRSVVLICFIFALLGEAFKNSTHHRTIVSCEMFAIGAMLSLALAGVVFYIYEYFSC